MATELAPTRSGHIHPDGHDIWYEYFGDGTWSLSSPADSRTSLAGSFLTRD
jgi:hypothetical protein